MMMNWSIGFAVVAVVGLVGAVLGLPAELADMSRLVGTVAVLMALVTGLLVAAEKMGAVPENMA